jgi:hypothetical protein
MPLWYFVWVKTPGAVGYQAGPKDTKKIICCPWWDSNTDNPAVHPVVIPCTGKGEVVPVLN